MFDAKKLLDQFLGSNVPGLSGSVRDKAGMATQIAKNNPMKAGAIAAAIFGTKTGRKLAGNAAAVGGIAAIAGLGYLAYRNYQSGQKPQAIQQPLPTQELLPPPVDSPFHPQSPTLSNNFALTLVQAMIAAAKADGHIDAAERARIMEKLQVSELDREAEAFIEKELADPLDIDALVSAAQTEEQKVEIYTASRLTIEPDSRAERGYLDLLAGRLGLPDALVEHIEATVSAAKV
ncbi:uncharacterized membrane protein YebE (DUF533 family) [Rhizobium skierniewicense]|uniref:Uncharacterized membrane protein YebE (DUF533 family) n=1 Tax=Rhizobium skierniewicense TaxID=984260 RepID=A0A7W6C7L5_9HYPH|nr:tellurite resistance TerB family protein [Rhizobium skierniewicense]MBB3946181.1 uncharacterized membrane protein YebE (DUF533 family) [Rhizobium skierniewicense]NTF32938.1 tellurite resistance TerB family protein [Rhizobium skierniewicense]